MKAPLALLVAAMLTGCSARSLAPTTPAALPQSAPVAVAAAKTTAKTAATLQATEEPCAAPLSIVYGLVYDSQRRPLKEGATIQVDSLDNQTPFHAEVEVINGTYVVSQAPVGVALEVKAIASGLTRVRWLTLPVTACDEGPAKGRLNFGGPATTDDPAAASFYLPNH